MQLRPRKHWWRHWWCDVPSMRKQSETDIFAVFERADGNRRFALHIENKKLGRKFEERQAEAYKERGICMQNDPAYMNYSDFATVLIAPTAVRDAYRDECRMFDAFIPYEEIAKFVPEFAST